MACKIADDDSVTVVENNKNDDDYVSVCVIRMCVCAVCQIHVDRKNFPFNIDIWIFVSVFRFIVVEL